MSVIPNLVTAKVIRNRMEDKNSLNQKGNLYVGTGVQASIDGKDTVYRTTSFIACPSTADKSGQAIIVTEASNVGLTVGKIGSTALGEIVQSIPGSGHIFTGISQSTGGGKLQFFTTYQEFLSFGEAKETTITNNKYYEIAANGSVFEGLNSHDGVRLIDPGSGKTTATVSISLEKGGTYLFAHTISGSTAGELYCLPPLYINPSYNISKVAMTDSVVGGGAGHVILTYNTASQSLMFRMTNEYGAHLYYKKIS